MKNHEMEQQVWQRVQASTASPPETALRQLLRETMELAAIYRGLASQLTGRPQELAKQLYAGEQANAAALAGIRFLSRESGEQLKLWQPGKEDIKKTLQRCYHRTRRALTEYTARSADREFGLVYDAMAKREGIHCTLLAELLGSLK